MISWVKSSLGPALASGLFPVKTWKWKQDHACRKSETLPYITVNSSVSKKAFANSNSFHRSIFFFFLAFKDNWLEVSFEVNAISTSQISKGAFLAKSKWTPLAELHQAGKLKKKSLLWPRFVMLNLHIPTAKLSFLIAGPFLIPELLFKGTNLLHKSFAAVQPSLYTTHLEKNHAYLPLRSRSIADSTDEHSLVSP